MPTLRPVWISTLLLAAAVTIATAGIPSSGTLSPSNLTLTYHAGPFTSVNPSPQLGDPDCSLFPNSCDDYALTVTVDAAYLAANPDHVVTIKVEWPTAQNDFDVYLQNPGNNQTIQSSASSSDPEIIVFTPTVGTTVYRIRVLAFSTANESFAGTITLGPRPTGGLGQGEYFPSSDAFTCNKHLEGQSAVFDHGGDGEPAVRFDPEGNAWVTGIAGLGGGIGLWKIPTTDVCAQSPVFLDNPDAGAGGGDTDIEVAPEKNPLGFYNIYTSSLTLANITSSTSADGGNTFVPVVISDPVPVNDRQWNAAYGAMTLYLSWRSLNAGNQLFCARSDDAGLTFGAPIPVYDDVVGTTLATQLGNMVADQRPGAAVPAAGPGGQGNVYHGYVLTTQGSTGHKVYVAVSRDFGLTWTSTLVFAGPPGATYDHIFSWVAVDEAGNVYTVWADGQNVFYSGSADIKTSNTPTWTAPVRVNNGAATKSCVLPMIDAGSGGRIVVAWYGTTSSSTTDPGAQWHYFHARCSNALDPLPVFEQARVSDHVVHTGVVCEDGLGCACCRDLLECQELDVNPVDGSSLVSYGGAGGIFLTKQVAGASAIAGKTIADNSGPCPTLLDGCTTAQPVASRCIEPGIQVISDPTGDVTAPGDATQDLQNVWIAEPFLGDGVRRLVFTIKVADLSSLPLNTLYTVLWNDPTAGDPYPRKFVQMNTCDPTVLPDFAYGHVEGSIQTQDGTLATGGSYTPDGTIRIAIDPGLVGDPQPAQVMSTIVGEVRLLAGTLCSGLITTLDNASASQNYTVEGNSDCKPHTATCPATLTDVPGDHQLTFSVNNPSTAPRTFNVTLSDANGWLVGGPLNQPLGPVSPNASASISVVARFPEGCTPTANDLFTWQATAPDLPGPGDVASCQTAALCDQATATLVGRFEARPVEQGVELLWSAHGGGDVMSWNIYRGSSPAGAFERVNRDPIPMGSGGEFRYVDVGADALLAYYRLAGVAADGSERVMASTSSQGTGHPQAFRFGLAGANPFRGATALTYALPERSTVRLEVYSVTGQRVRTLVDQVQEAGTYTVPFSVHKSGGRSLGAGVYLVRITAGRWKGSTRVIAFE